MRPVRAVGLYLILVFLGGALLAPWVYKLVQVAADVLPGLASPASKPFPRYVSRCFLVLAFVGLWGLLQGTNLLSWRALGLGRRPEAGRHLAYGFCIGLVSLACIVAIVLAAGARMVNPDLTATGFLGRGLKSVLTATVVASLEELLFRGALFGALKKTFYWPVALILSSVVYGLLHFLDRAGQVSQVVWSSGLQALAGMASGLVDPERLIPGLLNLTLAGIILGLAYQRSGSLYFSIGLHAGWIFWLKMYGSITATTGEGQAWFFGTNKLINGWLAFIVLATLLPVLSRRLTPADPCAGWKEKRLFS